MKSECHERTIWGINSGRRRRRKVERAFRCCFYAFFTLHDDCEAFSMAWRLFYVCSMSVAILLSSRFAQQLKASTQLALSGKTIKHKKRWWCLKVQKKEKLWENTNQDAIHRRLKASISSRLWNCVVNLIIVRHSRFSSKAAQRRRRINFKTLRAENFSESRTIFHVNTPSGFNYNLFSSERQW